MLPKKNRRKAWCWIEEKCEFVGKYFMNISRLVHIKKRGMNLSGMWLNRQGKDWMWNKQLCERLNEFDWDFNLYGAWFWNVNFRFYCKNSHFWGLNNILSESLISFLLFCASAWEKKAICSIFSPNFSQFFLYNLSLLFLFLSILPNKKKEWHSNLASLLKNLQWMKKNLYLFCSAIERKFMIALVAQLGQ